MADKRYEITFSLSDGTQKKVTFTSPQGEKGDPGASGVYIGSEGPTDPNVSVWIEPDGEPSGYEEWVFTLADGTTVTKKVVVLS